MNKIPFSVKLYLSYVLVVAVVALGGFHFMSRRIAAYTRESVAVKLRSLATTLGRELQPLADAGDRARLDADVKALGRRLLVRITLVDFDGLVLADSSADPAHMDNHASRPEIVGAVTNGEGQSIRFSQTVKDDLMYLAQTYPADGPARGVIRVSQRLHSINAMQQQLVQEILVIISVSLLMALLLAVVFARLLTRPVRKLAAAAERVSQGDFEVRVFLDRSDELKELADAFNRMAAEVSCLFQEMRRQSEESRVILASIREGLVVVDADARIVQANDAFWKILDCEPAPGKLYWEVLRAPKFAEGLRAAKEAGAGAAEEIALGDRTYLCGFNPLPGQAAVVVLFFDVTERKRLEEIKRELAVNISHEFKTPLTAIRGFAEALEEEPVLNREYVGIIRRNAQRLARITDDLLLLARLEQPVKALDLETVDLRELAESTGRLFQALLAKKGLAFAIEAAADLPRVRADRFMLEQVFINLLENAARYTERGGVKVALRRENAHAVVAVTDTGIGIAAEHLPRVFERFYVVDKSRSRATGGTGLGLSIVKNIVLQHGGAIDIRSEPGAGTTVTVSLPALP
jgi:two-component system phosphate regulon sensor histidine kinase PhoR